MGGLTSIEVKESVETLAEWVRQAQTSTAKERLQDLYRLKQQRKLGLILKLIVSSTRAHSQ